MLCILLNEGSNLCTTFLEPTTGGRRRQYWTCWRGHRCAVFAMALEDYVSRAHLVKGGEVVLKSGPNHCQKAWVCGKLGYTEDAIEEKHGDLTT